jgi:sugar O-acyltransferase (sialic acid O-acetyltransferase NeuD family)
MKKKLIIFGTGKIADVIYYYASEECDFKIAAFCVDKEFKTSREFHQLPVISIDEIVNKFPPDTHDMFIAIGYHDLNQIRADRCAQAIKLGYNLVSVISPQCKIPSNVNIGWNCFIMPPALIHPCVSIKNNVFIFSGALVAHHSVIDDNCWLTSSCNISGNVVVGANTFIAVNATIGHSVTIGKNCFLGANTLVTKNLDEEKVVISESSKPIRLTSRQFLKMSSFSSL